MPNLYGEVLRRDHQRSRLLLSVAVDRGDAKACGICGQVWLPMNRVTISPDPESGLEKVFVPTAIADEVSKGCQPCD
jgi:hypothetical protein